MLIRNAELADREQIVDLYVRSQAETGLPDPAVFPADELGDHLYARKAICRYVATDLGKIIAHGLIENANPDHLNVWRQGLEANNDQAMIEMGGAFVDPLHSRQGIWTKMLRHQLLVIKNMAKVPVSATWSQNQHVIRTFEANGGRHVGQQTTAAGSVDLFVF